MSARLLWPRDLWRCLTFALVPGVTDRSGGTDGEAIGGRETSLGGGGGALCSQSDLRALKVLASYIAMLM